MNNRIEAYIAERFRGVSMTQEAQELRDELTANCLARYEDALREGKSEEEAFRLTVENLGDIDALLAPFRRARGLRDLLGAWTGGSVGGAPKYTLLDETYDAAQIARLEIGLSYEDVKLCAEARTDVQVTFLCSEDDSARCPDVCLQGDTLTVTGVSRIRRLLTSGSGLLVVRVPEGQTLACGLHTASGSITADGVRMCGAQVGAASGSIRLSPDLSCRASGIEASTASGAIHVAAAADELRLHAASGGVHAQGSFGTVEANTASGGVRIACWTAPESICVDTASGAMRLTLPREIPGFTVDFSSFSGKLRNDFGGSCYGDGSTRICLNSASGGAHIRAAEGETE